MNATVRSFAHLVVGTDDLDAWQAFGSDLMGMQVASRDDDRMLLRMDEYGYRLDVRRSDHQGFLAVGWDAGTEAAMHELAQRLTDAGFDVTEGTTAEAKERQVGGLVRFRDPDDLYDIELIWGKKRATERFASPNGTGFVAGELGVGHIAQAVTDRAVYRRIYREIFGFRLSDNVEAHGGQAELEFLHCNPRHHSFAYIEVVDGVTPPKGIAHLMIEVDDFDVVGRTYEAVQNGAAPLRSTLGRHTNDRMTSWYALSPSGFGVEFGHGGILIDDETWLPTRYADAHTWGHKRVKV